MQGTAATIAHEQNLRSVEDRIAPVKELFRLQGASELQEAEERYLPKKPVRSRALILAAIRREYKGEEAHNRSLAVYRKHGVSHFYTFKSRAGFLIQIPIFIAALDMLGKNFRLAGEGFLWIEDLAAPDALAPLPFALPFFGGYLNLLPFVMTLFTVLAARWQEDATLSPSLLRAQRLKLYAMAGVFFVLLYTFPAAMVLYWTANNLWHLLRVGRERLRRPR